MQPKVRHYLSNSSKCQGHTPLKHTTITTYIPIVTQLLSPIDIWEIYKMTDLDHDTMSIICAWSSRPGWWACAVDINSNNPTHQGNISSSQCLAIRHLLGVQLNMESSKTFHLNDNTCNIIVKSRNVETHLENGNWTQRFDWAIVWKLVAPQTIFTCPELTKSKN